MSLFRVNRALLNALSSELSNLAPLSGSGFCRASYSTAEASSANPEPTVPIQGEWYNRHRSIMDLPGRAVNGRHSMHAVVDPGATVVGDVDLSIRTVVSSGAVLRGDLNAIQLGPWAQVGEGSVLHAARTSPTGYSAATTVGRYSYIGKRCMIRSASIGNFCDVGDGSIIMEGAMLEGFNALLPGTVVPPGRLIPRGEVWGGNPAKFVGTFGDPDRDTLQAKVEELWELAWERHCARLPYQPAYKTLEEEKEKMAAKGWKQHPTDLPRPDPWFPVDPHDAA